MKKKQKYAGFTLLEMFDCLIDYFRIDFTFCP